MRLPQARLQAVLDRFEEVEARMGAASDGAEIVRLSKEHAEIRPVADAVAALAGARAEALDLTEMAASPDAEMAELAREELAALDDRIPDLERRVALLLAPRDRDENASAIIEVRAGDRGRRGGPVRGRPVPHVPALCRAAELEGRDRQRLRG